MSSQDDKGAQSEVQIIICMLNRPYQGELHNNTFMRKVITEVKGIINKTKPWPFDQEDRIKLK